ncbi:protein S-acyltransferase [Ranunculus cassubicifolius]
MDGSIKEEYHVTSIPESLETTCWGCGLRLLLSSYTPVYKCGWCGAITKESPQNFETESFQWRFLRDRFFVTVLILFMLLVIGGGVWAVYPVIFSIGSTFGILHSIITAILSISTISSFSLSAFLSAGVPPTIIWGSYPALGKGALENYTFCQYCSKPKSPRTHHCRSCGTCVLDMDHHCPFIGNCVGATNHRFFILFLLSAVTSTSYVSIMSVYSVFHLWPPLAYTPITRLNTHTTETAAYRLLKDLAVAFTYSAVNLSARGLVLIYLFIAGASVAIGLNILLWQQLIFIYQGKTYLSNLSSQGDDGIGKRDCQNILRFFGFTYSASRFLPVFSRTNKPHKK